MNPFLPSLPPPSLPPSLPQSLGLCPQLEEVVLDDNLLVSLEPLKLLPRLRWVSAQDNLLGRLPSEATEVLKSLEYLNVSNNAVSTLHSIQVGSH